MAHAWTLQLLAQAFPLVTKHILPLWMYCYASSHRRDNLYILIVGTYCNIPTISTSRDPGLKPSSLSLLLHTKYYHTTRFARRSIHPLYLPQRCPNFEDMARNLSGAVSACPNPRRPSHSHSPSYGREDPHKRGVLDGFRRHRPPSQPSRLPAL
jgi:hypothetical protein